MIPGKIMKFLEEDATVAAGGTRSKHLIPHIHRVSGWSVGPDRQTISCSIPEEFTHDLLSSLADNGQFALTVEQIGTHETYQFKGEYVGSRPPDEADVVSSFYPYSEEQSRAYVMNPGIVISFKVREIFIQTPGPRAGHRLVPPEEE
jgi:hypothetical protein